MTGSGGELLQFDGFTVEPILARHGATEPMFQAIADEDPNIVTVSRGYREPVCFDTEASFDGGR